MKNKQDNVERFNTLASEWDSDSSRVLMGQKVARDPEDGGFHSDAKGVTHHGFARDAFGEWLKDVGFADVEFSTAFTAHRENDDALLSHLPGGRDQTGPLTGTWCGPSGNWSHGGLSGLSGG